MEEVTSEPVVLVCVRRRGEFPVPCCCLLRWFHDPALGDRLIRDLDFVPRDLPSRDLWVLLLRGLRRGGQLYDRLRPLLLLLRLWYRLSPRFLLLLL